MQTPELIPQRSAGAEDLSYNKRLTEKRVRGDPRTSAGTNTWNGIASLWRWAGGCSDRAHDVEAQRAADPKDPSAGAADRG